ncbi:MAG: hypothetical protein OWQ54_04370 [Sulfolobaceae archaeon]|nr:hypothetical protein [Sulfolobaceae archaeon]
MSNSLPGHDDVLKNYVPEKYAQTPIICYIHDLFKGLFPSGGKKGGNPYAQYYNECDKIASIAEEYKKFIDAQKDSNSEKNFVKLMSDLPSLMTITFDLRGFPIVSSNMEISRANFSDKFEDISKNYVKEFIDLKYGKGKYDNLMSIIEKGEKPNIEYFSALVDSIRLFPQRSWVSANDISVLAHLKGALIADLLDKHNKVKVFILSNPFEAELRTLKDARGFYVITNAFMYNLNRCLWEKLNVNLEDSLKKIVDLKKALPDVFLNASLMDFFNSFIFDVSVYEKEEAKSSIKVVYHDEQALKECVMNSVSDTISYFLKLYFSNNLNFSDKLLEKSLTITISEVYEVSKGEDENNNAGKTQNLAKALNEILKEGAVGDIKSFEMLGVQYNGLSTSGELCSRCKVRSVISLPEETWKDLRERHIVKEDEKLCDVCLASRLASTILKVKSTETSSLYDKRMNSILVGHSIDEFAKDEDIIYIAFKLDDKKLQKQRQVNLFEFYGYNYSALKEKILKFLKEIINKIKEDSNRSKSLNQYCDLNKSLNDFDKILYEMFEDFKNVPNANSVANFLIDVLCPSIKQNENDKKKVQGIIKKDILGEDKNYKILNDLFNNVLLKGLDKVEQLKVLFEVVGKIQDMIVDIPVSLDRVFSARIQFSILVELFEYILLSKKVDYITLLPQTMVMSFSIFAIRKSDFKKAFEAIGDLFGFFSNNSKKKEEVLEHSIKIYLIRAKPEIPIYFIYRLLSKNVAEAPNSTVVDIVPVILVNGGLPIGDLNSFSYNDLKRALDKITDSKRVNEFDPDKVKEFFVSSAPDVTYPEFRGYKELEGFEKYVKKYSSNRKPFSVQYEKDDIAIAYMSRLLR